MGYHVKLDAALKLCRYFVQIRPLSFEGVSDFLELRFERLGLGLLCCGLWRH